MFRSIIVGTDGSETAAWAVREAGELSLKTDSQVHVVSAHQSLYGTRVGHIFSAASDSPGLHGHDTTAHEVALEKAEAALRGMGVRAECHLRTGDAAAVILNLAEEKHADLIVVGNKGMQGSKRFLLGSVSDKVSHYAGCSVLIVHTT